ncbi:hypothetical protein SK128_007160 [Halocaridina rubra]|uniref:Uncharacterized protein n=1 Tax=Halocaridina rubra TaxID=373956 RepID=A0AAN8WMP0_HALRR
MDDPIDLGPIAPRPDWLIVVQPVIQRRIQKCTKRLAIVSDRKMVIKRNISKIQKEIESEMVSLAHEEAWHI